MKVFFATLVGFLVVPAAIAAVAPRHLTLCLPYKRAEFLHMVALQALDSGFFQQRSLNIKVRYLRNGDRTDWSGPLTFVDRPEVIDRGVASAVASGECDFGGSQIERFIGDSKGAAKIQPLFVSNYGEGYDTHLVVASNSKLRSLQDLKGKVIETGGLLTYLAVVSALESAGIALNQVTIVNKGSGKENVMGLYNGQVDAVTGYLPFIALALASGQVKVLANNIVKKFVTPRLPHSMLVVNRNLLARDPAAVQMFRDSIVEAKEYLARNPAEFFYIRKRHLGLVSSERRLPAFLAERATAFIGNVTVADPTKDGDALFCDLQDFVRIVGGRGYHLDNLNFVEWLGLKIAPTCSIQEQRISLKHSFLRFLSKVNPPVLSR